MSNYEKIMSPIKVGNLTLRNRLLASPVGSEGLSCNDTITHLGELARGGAAVVTFGCGAVDNEKAQLMTHNIVVGKENATFLGEIAAVIKQYGAVPSMELLHAGQWGNHFEGVKWGPINLIRSDGEKVVAMDEDMMKRVAEHYANAAVYSKKVGFEMLLLHFGHGWLPAQFLSPYFNKRTDNFGGSLENRARFPKLIIDEIRKAVGNEMAIEMRISGHEFVEGSITTRDVIDFVKMVENQIDMVHVSGGIDKIPEACLKMIPTIFTPHGLNVKNAEAVKKEVSIPVSTVAGITTPELAEEIVASGKADVIHLARALIADPEFVNKIKYGKRDEIVQCTRCTSCYADTVTKKHIDCAVNDRAFKERRIDLAYMKPPLRQKVVVVGGGCAGMKAAITAKERGHDVILLEKTDGLGGLLKFTKYDDLKIDLKGYLDYLIGMIKKMKIDVRFNTEATKEIIKELEPEALIVAVGSELIIPNIPGLEASCKVMDIHEMYDSMDKVGNKVVIIGGGQAGCETAYHLAQKGHKVAIVEMRDELAKDAHYMNRGSMLQAFEKQPKLVSYVNTRCTEILPEGIQVVNSNGERFVIEADTIVYCVGLHSRKSVVDELSEIIPKTFVIGDCVKPRRVNEATREAFHAGMQI